MGSDFPNETKPSAWAVGWTFFAATMMIMIGVFHAIAGLIALFDDEWYTSTGNYIFKFDTTGWGWIHLIVGIVLIASGVGIFKGHVAGRVIGVIVAGLTVIANFMWLPYYPFWAIVLIGLNVAVIWALAVSEAPEQIEAP